MTTKTERLLALAERCEEATGPDRDLDCDIARAIGALGRYSEWSNTKLICNPFSPVRLFTTSLDAAVTLIPDGVYWEVCGDNSAIVRTCPDYDHIAFADSPALAMCAAALHAHAAEDVE